MPNNSIIHNTGGIFRFTDYVSMLPEFMRDEEDVVVLLQIFSDYINNAYRNTTVASKFEFKLVSTEGHANTRLVELKRLAALFSTCENRNVPILFMMKPKNIPSLVVNYSGHDENPPCNIIPGGCSIGERIFINYDNDISKSGVYIVVDDNGGSTGNPSTLIIDVNGRDQDLFTDSVDSMMMSPIGYVPRMIQFQPSNVTDVAIRNVGEFDGVLYQEVYFTSSITEIQNVPSVNEVIVDGNKILIDYYGIVNSHPLYSKVVSMKIESDVACNAYNLGRGIFYAKELSKINLDESLVNANGVNKYCDPYYEPTNELFFSRRVINQNNRHLIMNASNIINVDSINIDDVSGMYINRVNVGDVFSIADISLIDIVENLIKINTKTSLKIGNWVKVDIQANSSIGVNSGIYYIEYVSDDGLWIKLKDADFQNPSTGSIKLSLIEITKADIGKIEKITSTTIEIDRYCGDLITSGYFVVRSGKNISLFISIENNVYVWNNYSFYAKNTFVYYNGYRYIVIKTHYSNELSSTPNAESKYYKIDMDTITVPIESIEYNPYMVGAYIPMRIGYSSSNEYMNSGLSYLYQRILVQQSEETGIIFKNKQRNWIFNPRLAKPSELIRNGWMNIYQSSESRDNDLGNKSAKNLGIHINQILVTDKTAVISSVTSFSKNIVSGTSIRISGSDISYMNNIHTVISVLSNNSLQIEITGDIIDQSITDESINIYMYPVDKIYNDITIYSRENLFDVSSINPLIAKDGEYYKYSLNEVDWSRYVTAKSVDYTEISTNVSILNGEQLGLVSGSFVKLTNQTIISQNGLWIVRKGKWDRYGNKLTLKSSSMSISGYVPTDYDVSNQVTYITYSADYIAAHDGYGVFVAELDQIKDYKFTRPSIEDIDTNSSLHQIYDANRDSNTVTTIDGFNGIDDMKYPLIEKIERLMYQKDPNVIDLELIGYLARFMGYDITPIYTDIQRSDLYTRQKDREMAIRKTIQYLPEFNALKSTEGGLNSLLLTFGLISKVITMWTDGNNPYNIMIPNVDVDDYRYMKMDDGQFPVLVPTPHFMVRIEVDGNFNTSLTLDDIGRARSAIINYKPINTVFNGIEAYLKVTTNVAISISPLNSLGRMRIDIGYNMDDLSTVVNNCGI